MPTPLTTCTSPRTDSDDMGGTLLGSVSGPLHGVRDMGHPEDHCVESPERFDEFTGPYSTDATERTDAPFDAAGWIANTAPNTLPTVRSICPELVPLIVGMVDAAYEQGRNDQQKRITARVDNLMRARFGEVENG